MRRENFMASDVQTNHSISVTTPVGKDLILIGMSGSEGISQLFRFQLDLIAPHGTQVAFEDLLGQPITIELKTGKGKARHISGICSSVRQDEADDSYKHFRADIVPQLWLMTRKAQSRIFQSLTVPEILKKVLEDVKPELKLEGDFQPRDYCVQYRETDFNFASRLMEEEGMYYYFAHDSKGHKMVISNAVGGPDLPLGKEISLQSGMPSGDDDPCIFDWGRYQELRSGKYTLWDHCFEKTRDNLEAFKEIAPSVKVGGVTHKLKVAGNEKLELYDYPGEYAQRFDGVQPGGGDRKEDIEKIADDKKRTVNIRMQEEAVQSVLVDGASTCGHMVPGYKFSVKTLADDKLAKLQKADGAYVITRVVHNGSAADYRSGSSTGFLYQNTFACIPADLQFRPRRRTKKPFIPGTQTALVVGSGQKDEEILTDKYGRVKVQFHWDRPGTHNHEKNQETQGKYKYSSCWVRVAQVCAGKRWGASFWPRIGQEVVVSFLEGDPDRPIIVGSVYNNEQMPPYLGEGFDSKHKNDNKITGIKSNTTTGGQGFNEWRFDDTKDKEQFFLHAERNMDVRVKNESMERVISHRHLIVGWKSGDEDGDFKQGGDQRELVYKDKHLNVKGNHVEKVEGNLQLTVGKGEAKDGGNVDVIVEKDRKELIEKNEHLTVKGNRSESIGGGQSLTVGGDQNEKISNNHNLEAGMCIHVKAGMTLVMEAGAQLSLKVGGNFIDINPAGVFIQGTTVMINSGGAAGSGPGAKPAKPEEPKEAKPTKPTLADNSKPGLKSAP
jgi:type VI secretion system secreted protein VgrG